MIIYNAWTKWLNTTPPGVPKLYHIGQLSVDRLHNKSVDDLARLLAALSELGYVRLYQKRVQHLMHYFVVTAKQFLPSRGHDHGYIAEAEALAGLPLTEGRSS